MVILSKLLSGEETAGFSNCEDLRVHSFNGQPVRSLQHLARMVHGCRAPFLRFDLDHHVRAVLACILADAGHIHLVHSLAMPCVSLTGDVFWYL